MERKLLCISYRFPPETYPLATRVTYMLEQLEQSWSIDAITAARSARVGQSVKIHHVPARTPEKLIRWMRRFKMAKLINLMFWPDQFVFWVFPAYRKALKLIEKEKPDLILIFMMPYSTGLVGLLLKRKTGLPLVLNLNDSPTCTDMNPSFPSRLHFKLAHWLEDQFARKSDAVIYVSGKNMQRVRMRQDKKDRDKFHLIRRGARLLHRNGTRPSPEKFRIIYTGGMSGWYHLLPGNGDTSLPQRLFKAWERFGRYSLVELDHRSHSPVFIGQAIQKLIAEIPEWKTLLEISIYGNRYPDPLVKRVLEQYGLGDLVKVYPPIPHDEVCRHIQEADLLFMALPERVDGSPGGRISAKTYEYLMTDRPILAAIPEGENKEFLQDKPGVYLAAPKDSDAMAEVIRELLLRKMKGADLAVDRLEVQNRMTNTARARDFSSVLNKVMDL